MLGEEICGWVDALKKGYKTKYGLEFNDIIHLHQSPLHSFFKVQDAVGEWQKFSIEGAYMD